jgi:putative solute:sodium symporter small subunit
MNPVKVILTLIPFIWSIGMIPFANRVKPFVFGLPFLAFWFIAGIVVVYICLTILYKMDKKDEKDSLKDFLR